MLLAAGVSVAFVSGVNVALLERRVKRRLGPLSLRPAWHRWLSRLSFAVPLFGWLISPAVVRWLSTTPIRGGARSKSLSTTFTSLLLDGLERSRLWIVWLFGVNLALLVVCSSILGSVFQGRHGLELFVAAVRLCAVWGLWQAVRPELRNGGGEHAAKIRLRLVPISALLPLPWAALGLLSLLSPELRRREPTSTLVGRAFSAHGTSQGVWRWRRLEEQQRRSKEKGSLFGWWWSHWGAERWEPGRTKRREDRFARTKMGLLVVDGACGGVLLGLGSEAWARCWMEGLSAFVGFVVALAVVWSAEPLWSWTGSGRRLRLLHRLLTAGFSLLLGLYLGLALVLQSAASFGAAFGRLAVAVAVVTFSRVLWTAALAGGIGIDTGLRAVGGSLGLLGAAAGGFVLARSEATAELAVEVAQAIFLLAPLWHVLWAFRLRPWLPVEPWLRVLSWMPLGGLAMPFFLERRTEPSDEKGSADA